MESQTQPRKPPRGIVFASFMCSIWIGGSIFEHLMARKYRTTSIVCFVVYGVMFANAGAAYASANHPRTSYILFLLIELFCGIYFPAMGYLRTKVLPAAHHATIMNWFRVPLNVIASIVLLYYLQVNMVEPVTLLNDVAQFWGEYIQLIIDSTLMEQLLFWY